MHQKFIKLKPVPCNGSLMELQRCRNTIFSYSIKPMDQDLKLQTCNLSYGSQQMPTGLGPTDWHPLLLGEIPSSLTSGGIMPPFFL